MKKTLTLTILLLVSSIVFSQEVPVAATHIPDTTSITWVWHTVTDATGYKINSTDVYATASDAGGDTNIVQTTLTPNTVYTRYIWAYNTCGHSSSTTITSMTLDDFVCGTNKVISHVAGDVAPVDKTVTYGTVTNIPGETTKCWITSNLGASRQALAKNDTTEASAGWYWQFNRKQGYKYAGTTRTPNTTWITGINEYSDWITANDPCAIEFGSGWRMPTSVEWINVDASGGWTNLTAAWNSALKLHAAGWLDPAIGTISFRGLYGGQWSSSQTANTTMSYGLFFFGSSCGVSMYQKITGYSIRCLKDSTQTGGGGGETTIPTVTTTAVSNINQTTATGGGNITSSGGTTLITKGICWNTSTTPTTSNSHTTEGTDIGVFVSNITGLTANTLYYVRAYAINSVGTAYGSQVTFTTLTTSLGCGANITITHTIGTVAPVTKTVTYGTVTNVPGEPTKCWITSNLGATNQAGSRNDTSEASAGWYWQFNRMQGYKYSTVRTPSTTWITSINEDLDWAITNDPCAIEIGTGWHIPTVTEWTNVDAAGLWTNATFPYNSLLKLHMAGYLYYTTGTLRYRGITGIYWSNIQYNNTYSENLYFTSSICRTSLYPKSMGFSVRCIK